MARKQLGAAESNSKDAATKGYVDSAVQNGIGTYTDPASNLVVDPSFDVWSGTAFSSWNTFWNGGTAGSPTQTNGPGTDAVDVNAAKVLFGAASSFRRFGSTVFAVTPGQRYEIQVWARGTGSGPQLAMDVLSNTLSTNVDYFQSGVTDSSILATFNLTSTWTLYTGYWTCPAGVSFARLYLALSTSASGASGDVAEIDRAVMRLAQAPTTFNGVPSGGATAAVLAKASASDQDVTWTPSASAGTPSTQMLRDAAGRAQVVDPSAAQDIATKNYVDLAIARDPVARALYR